MRDPCRIWSLALGEAAPEDAVRPLLGFLDADELTRLERLKIAADRALFVAGRALARGLLSAIDGGPPQGWRFAAGAHGRLAIDGGNPQSLSFNISHTPGLAVCAAMRGAAVGVDVERLDRATRFDDLARRKFAAGERALLQAAPAAQKPRTFFSLWTLKEAYIKAIGRGLAEPLDGFAFTIDPLAATFTNGDDPEAWHFRLLDPTPDHILGLAVGGAGPECDVVHQGQGVDGLARRLQGG